MNGRITEDMAGTSWEYIRVRMPFAIRFLVVGLWMLGSLLITDCRSKNGPQPSQQVTISFFGWGPGTLFDPNAAKALLEQFTSQTGIQVRYIAAPESADDTLSLLQKWFSRKSESPDVLYTDTIWPGLLANDLLDLNPYLGNEAKTMWPGAVQNETVDGRLVGLPFNLEIGVLHYRDDLLKKYGFDHPPRTWKELEQMAARIQEGERARGRKNFWGFVWQGAPYEGLTCNALEWQESYGGGDIIESNGVVSVNNPRTIAAIKMAKSWIGTISPPSVLTFMEEDSRSVWDRGDAAFRRDWVWRGSQDSKRFILAGSMAPLPGQDRQVSVSGNVSLSVSKYSRHPRESAELIRFLTSREIQLKLSQAFLPAIHEFYENPTYYGAQPQLASLIRGSISRPSTVSGSHYPEVTRRYYTAVHSALAGKISVEKAMKDLETQLLQIPGFKSPHLSRQEHSVPQAE